MSDEIKDDKRAGFAAPPLTVIVAEKYPIARAALAALLSYDGYRVFQAESLAAAISCISTVDNVDVLLADLEMQGWRSIVRHAVKTCGTFVVAMEGNQPISDMYDLTKYGIRVCFKKPIVYADILTAIRRNIGESGGCELPHDESTFNDEE